MKSGDTYRHASKSPLNSWDIYSMHQHQFSKVEMRKKETEFLHQLRDHYKWKTDLDTILDKEYHALVLTDDLINIQWVNRGFYALTGYLEREVLGKKPRILQGSKTAKDSRIAIRESLYSGYSFSTTLVNYRKNKEEYNCRVSIYPLFNSKKDLTHFIALESEA
jgi:PAS domain S-box-containing protein